MCAHTGIWVRIQVEVRQRRWRGRDTSVTIPAGTLLSYSICVLLLLYMCPPTTLYLSSYCYMCVSSCQLLLAEEDDEHAHAASVWHAVLNTWLSVAGNLEVTCQLVPGASGHDRPLTNTTAPAAAARTAGAAPPAAAAAVRTGAATGGGGTRPRDAVPPEFCCAISGKVMRRPVLAADGYTYEREEIEARIRGLLLTSPVTNEPLADLKLVPNRVLEALIAKY